jgi:hypothetical protein
VPNAPLGYNTPSACKLHGGERALRPHAAAIAYPSSDPQTAAPFDSQQYFSLTTNQPPATSQQYSSLEQTSTSHQPSPTSQSNRLWVGWDDDDDY